MSFGGVDEKKLAAEAAAQIAPMLHEAVEKGGQDIRSIITETLEQYRVIITFERKNT